MSGETGLPTLAPAEILHLDIRPAGVVDLRRDIYQFVRYVRDKGLVRTRNDNDIPKSAARPLAKLLSWAGEARAVEAEGSGIWSDHVSGIARALGLVTYDIEGVYIGYHSSEPRFPDNQIEVVEKAWTAWLKQSALEKERAILEVLLSTTPNEFFGAPTLESGERFDLIGSATGPAGKMNLPVIRRGLLRFLAELAPGVWYETRAVVARWQSRRAAPILDPATRAPDDPSQERLRKWEWDAGGKRAGATKPAVTLEDLYVNFREHRSQEDLWRREGIQITSQTPDAFHRVEGRYVEFFLREIPTLCGFVDRAYRRRSDPHGRDLLPPFERLRAFRLTPRFFHVLHGDAALGQVKLTVLPTFEVVVEAASYPETVLEALEPFATRLGEEGPIHRLRLEKKKVVEASARNPGASVADVLAQLATLPVPENVAVELASWAGRGRQVVFYEGLALAEIQGSAEDRRAILAGLGELVEDARPEGFAVVRDPARAFARLEEMGHVPIRVAHRESAFLACPGRLGSAGAGTRPSRPTAPPRVQARLESEDLVGCRSSCAALLAALEEALRGEAATCVRAGEDLLVVSAAGLPKLRAALRRLAERFDVSAAGGNATEARVDGPR